jgi:predicted nuclease with TOPRIM domain
MEEEGKCVGLADKLEKERKNLRAWQDRCGLSEAALRKAQDESEERASEVEIREARLKALESEMVLLRSEVDLREGEAAKLRAVNDALEGENRRLREEVGDLTLRLREEQGASVAEGKKARE